MQRRALQLVLVTSLLLVAPEAWAERDQSARPPDRFPSDVASVWFDMLYDVIRVEATAPPPAARIYGVVAVALYEAIAPGSRQNRSLVGQLNDLTSVPRPERDKTYHWPTVANAALARAIRGIFPSLTPDNRHAIDALEARFAAQFEEMVAKRDHRHSVAHGRTAAEAILAWAGADGFSEFSNCPYVPASVPGAWKPTPPGFAPDPLQPCWGQLRPMVLTSGSECFPPGPPIFATNPRSPFFAAALEVYRTHRNLTEEQKTIASYWADAAGATGTPPGHWIAIVGQMARSDELSLVEAAEAYARVGIAVTDAFVACWSAKYAFNLQRPVTYIRDHIDATWLPFIVTPPFPTYTSGHSSQSGAAARILTDMFGAKAFIDTLHEDHDLVPAQRPRSFLSFDEAAAEAAVSRLYGGIHYAFDNHDGLTTGRCVGQAILDRVNFRRFPSRTFD